MIVHIFMVICGAWIVYHMILLGLHLMGVDQVEFDDEEYSRAQIEYLTRNHMRDL